MKHLKHPKLVIFSLILFSFMRIGLCVGFPALIVFEIIHDGGCERTFLNMFSVYYLFACLGISAVTVFLLCSFKCQFCHKRMLVTSDNSLIQKRVKELSRYEKFLDFFWPKEINSKKIECMHCRELYDLTSKLPARSVRN
jgi:hypothetical protein